VACGGPFLSFFTKRALAINQADEDIADSLPTHQIAIFKTIINQYGQEGSKLHSH
jgi:hypothetical protein